MGHPASCWGCRALVCVPAVVGPALAADWAFVRRGHLAASDHAGLHRAATGICLVGAALHFYFSDIRRVLNRRRTP